MSLKEKLKQELETSQKRQVDWEKRKSDWLKSVEELQELIVGWFSDYQSEGLVSFSYTDKTHSEEYIGEYKVRVLHLNFANGREVVVEPMGTLIIGAWARFDFYLRGYNSNKYYILRFRNEDKFSWNIIDSEKKKGQQPLTKEYLEKVIGEWLS